MSARSAILSGSMSRAVPPVRSAPLAGRRVVLLLTVLLGGLGLLPGGWGHDVAAPASAQELGSASGDQLKILTVDASALPGVTATVALPRTVQDEEDASDDLSVSSAGESVEATIERVSPDAQTVAVLLDNADGITLDAFDAQLGAIAEFVLELDPATPVVIGSSADGVVFGPGTDRRAALLALGQLRKGGNREWGPTLASALDAVGSSASLTVVVVAAAPSPPDVGAPPDLPGRLEGQGVPVRWIKLRDDAGPPDALGTIRSVTSATEEGLLATLDVIAAELDTQYVLRFRADRGMSTVVVTFERDGRTWTVEAPILPSAPGDAELSPQPGDETGSAPGQEPSTERTDRPAAAPAGGPQPAPAPDRRESVLGGNWKPLTAVAAAGLLLGIFAVVTRGRQDGSTDADAADRPMKETISRQGTEHTL